MSKVNLLKSIPKAKRNISNRLRYKNKSIIAVSKKFGFIILMEIENMVTEVITMMEDGLKWQKIL